MTTVNSVVIMTSSIHHTISLMSFLDNSVLTLLDEFTNIAIYICTL